MRKRVPSANARSSSTSCMSSYMRISGYYLSYAFRPPMMRRRVGHSVVITLRNLVSSPTPTVAALRPVVGGYLRTETSVTPWRNAISIAESLRGLMKCQRSVRDSCDAGTHSYRQRMLQCFELIHAPHTSARTSA